jgi:hypothetical protein
MTGTILATATELKVPPDRQNAGKQLCECLRLDLRNVVLQVQLSPATGLQKRGLSGTSVACDWTSETLFGSCQYGLRLDPSNAVYQETIFACDWTSDTLLGRF